MNTLPQKFPVGDTHRSSAESAKRGSLGSDVLRYLASRMVSMHWCAVTTWIYLFNCTLLPATMTEAEPPPQGFEVHGRIYWCDPRQWTFHFAAKVAGNRWEICTWPGRGHTADKHPYDQCIAVCDGETLYWVIDGRKALQQRIAQGGSAAIGDAEGLVYTNHPVPSVPVHSGVMAPVWLAFCSELFSGR